MSSSDAAIREQKLITMQLLYTSFKEACPGKTREDFAEWLRAQVKEQMPGIPKNVSPELRKMIEQMYKGTPPHVDVFPPEPKKGSIMIPTGGLARCQCTPVCNKDLPIPAYRVIEEDESDGLGYEPNGVFKRKN